MNSKIYIWKIVMVGLLTMILGAGCQNTQESTNRESSEQQLKPGDRLSPISKGKWGPEERSFLRVPGTYSSQNYDKLAVEEELDHFPLDLTEKEYLEKLYSLLAEDYRPHIKKFNKVSTELNVNDPNVQTSIQLPAEKKVHFSILIDASGSMNEKIGSKTKMEIAKEAVQTFAKGLPKNAEISLRVYGHQGTSSPHDKEVSCNSTQEIYRSEGYDAATFNAALKSLQPAGWTPIAKALESVKQDVKPETTESMVYVVSDGEETCGGDPVKAASELNQSNVKTVVNIIGFDVNNAGQQKLKAVADAGNGEFISVNDEKALKKYLADQYDQLRNQWRQWMTQEKDHIEDQAKNIKRDAEDMQKGMQNTVYQERDHLLEAQQYLVNRVRDEQEYPTSSHPVRKLRRLILERSHNIRDYAQNRYYAIRNTVNKNERRERQDINDQGYDGIRDTREEQRNH